MCRLLTVSVGLTGWSASAIRVATPANRPHLQTWTLLISQQEAESRVGTFDHVDRFTPMPQLSSVGFREALRKCYKYLGNVVMVDRWFFLSGWLIKTIHGCSACADTPLLACASGSLYVLAAFLFPLCTSLGWVLAHIKTDIIWYGYSPCSSVSHPKHHISSPPPSMWLLFTYFSMLLECRAAPTS